MSRATVVFGNGLGMALDPDYFLLESGLREVWSGSPHFNEQHKRLVASAIPDIIGDAHPSTERQLNQLHVAIVASEFLREFETNEVKWLAPEASELPEAFKRFLHEVASYFHNHKDPLPINFVTALAEFTNTTKSHITTLNYDNLLYDGFKGHDVLNGYRGTLLDGFLPDGFAAKNLDRHYPSRHGWYLHLHGSPLFVGNQKIMREARRFFEPTESSHIVLTHVEHKPLVIERSDILSTYWSYLHDALAESETYILFGYSGEDVHLNRAIVDRVNEKRVHVIEWSGVGATAQRQSYWEGVLKTKNVNLTHLDCILSFVSWNDL